MLGTPRDVRRGEAATSFRQIQQRENTHRREREKGEPEAPPPGRGAEEEGGGGTRVPRFCSLNWLVVVVVVIVIITTTVST